MPAGVNANGNLNLIIFEVVCIIRNPETGTETVFTVSIHPLVVVPSMIRYTNTSRTSVTQTATGSQVARGGRAHQQVQLQGDWGVRSVGLGPYIGTGEVRAARFEREVVDMSDAIEQKRVDEAINILTGTPFLKLFLARYYAQPENCSFAINYYDLWHDKRFSAVVQSYSPVRQARHGGATGLISYQMAIQQVGDIVVGSPTTAALQLLFNGLAIWSDINAVLESYTVSSIVNSFAAVGGIATSQLLRTRDAVVGQIEAVTGLLGGYQNSSNSNLNSFLANSRALAESAEEISDALAAVAQPQVDAPKGGTAWGSENPDLQSASEIMESAARSASTTQAFEFDYLRALDDSDALDDLAALAFAARWQLAAGRLFGMSDEEYQRLLSDGRRGGRRRVRGTVPHTVDESDTASSLEESYGVSFDLICAWNDLLPTEALVAGTVLEIPRRAYDVGISTIDGLPTFGSHIGPAAWGRDLAPDLEVDDDGDFIIVEGEEVLEQGMNWAIEENSDEILKFSNAVLPGGLSAVASKIADILATDPRLLSIDSVRAEIADDGSLQVATTATAINGGTVETGGR